MIAYATSSGSPKRFNGYNWRLASHCSSVIVDFPSFNGVSTIPGNTALQRIFFEAKSNAAFFINADKPPFVAEYKLFPKEQTPFPDIEDVRVTISILKRLGCKVKKERNKLTIDSSTMNQTTIPDDLMRKLRSSVIIVGAILSRFKNVSFSHPGRM